MATPESSADSSAGTELVGESFDEYRNSFSYGSRTDLLCKWMKSGSEKLADEFLQELLELTGNLIDDGDTAVIVEAMVRAQSEAYSGPGNFVYDSAPFATLDQPVSESRIVLVTTTGHFVVGDDPNPMGIENLTQKQVVKMTTEFQRVDPELSEIPISTPRDQTRVRHGGYDIRATAADRNVSLPIDRMIELADEGVIGEFVNPVFSFVGMTSQLRLRKQIGAEWAARAKAAGAQAAVLIPI